MLVGFITLRDVTSRGETRGVRDVLNLEPTERRTLLEAAICGVYAHARRRTRRAPARTQSSSSSRRAAVGAACTAGAGAAPAAREKTARMRNALLPFR